MLASIGKTISSAGYFHLYCGVQIFGSLAEGYFKRHIVSAERHYSELIITKVLQVGLAALYLSQFNIGTALIGFIGIIPFALRLISEDYTNPKIDAVVTTVSRVMNVFFQTCGVVTLYGTGIGICAGILFTAVQLYALKPALHWQGRIEWD